MFRIPSNIYTARSFLGASLLRPEQPSVLVVDDSRLVRRRLVTLLQDLDPEVVVGEAGDPGAALDLLRWMRPDVVILDLNLPGGSGFDVLRDIRKQPDPPLVMIFTSHGEEPYRRRSLEGGADFFFDKGKDLAQLLVVVRSCLQARGRAVS
jgi:DNA-binding NarL/FixJ family response regulator